MIRIKTNQHTEFIDITHHIEEEVEKSKISEGLINVFVAHATAAILVNENHDPNVLVDLQKKIDELIPLHDGYLHDRIDNNAAAHLKACLFKPSMTLQIREGKLHLGTWQQIMLAEFDGPRERRIDTIVLAGHS